MWRRRAYVRLSVALALASVTFFTTSAYGQSPARRGPDNEVVAAQGPRLNNPEKKVVVDDPRPVDLEKEVAAVKAENAAVREQLRKMEEQQKALLELVKRLQQRLDGTKAADVSVPVTNTASVSVDQTTPVQPDAGNVSARQASGGKQEKEDRYQDGITIYQNPDDAKVRDEKTVEGYVN